MCAVDSDYAPGQMSEDEEEEEESEDEDERLDTETKTRKRPVLTGIVGRVETQRKQHQNPMCVLCKDMEFTSFSVSTHQYVRIEYSVSPKGPHENFTEIPLSPSIFHMLL